MKQEEEEKSQQQKHRESGTLYFTHMGSRSRRTGRYEIWQFSSSDQRYHLFKIRY